MAKLIALSILLTSEWRALPDPFLPFVPFFDLFHSTALFRWALKIALLGSLGCLLFNRWVRTACAVAGSVFLIGMLASRPYFTNNRMFAGCVLFLLGLYQPRQKLPLLRLQIVLVYIGAAVNKLLDVNWRNGQFFQYWAGIYVKEPLYFWAASLLPEKGMALLMSWFTMIIECFLAVGFLLRRFWTKVIWLGLLFHGASVFLTNRTFGIFICAIPASYLAFAVWPEEPFTVLYDGDCGFCSRTRRFFERFDFGHKFNWVPFQQTQEHYGIPQASLLERVYVVGGGKTSGGYRAFQRLFLYNPVTYFVMALLIATPPVSLIVYRRWLIFVLMAIFSPLLAPVGERVYAVVARNRHRLSAQACPVPPSQNPSTEAPVSSQSLQPDDRGPNVSLRNI
jgi:predicted DCC family thiol-disulfide oxidoreductase YuxK